MKIGLKQLETGQDMEIVDNRASAQIEEILPYTSVAGASPLPSTNMGQRVFDSNPFTQIGSSLWGLLTRSQLDE